MVTARQHGDACARGNGAIENKVSEPSAGMARHNDVGRKNLDVFERAGDRPQASGQPRPGPHQDVMQLCARSGQRLVDREGAGRRIVEQQHDLRQQTVAGREVDDASAAEEAPHPPRHLPRLVQLFARQASRVAHGTRHAMKERVVGKAIQVAIGQAGARRGGEHYFARPLKPCARIGSL